MNKINVGKDLYLKGRIGWKGLSKDEYQDYGEYRIINGTSLDDKIINWDICGFISKERYDESPEIQLLENDILISKDGTLGKIGYVKKLDNPSTVASGVFVLRNIRCDILNTDYLYHFLKSKKFKNFVFRNKVLGSTINHLYQRDLEELVIDIPDKKEQSKIAKFLNILDSKIEINDNINSELEAFAKTLYDYWFVQFDFSDKNGKPYKTSSGKMKWSGDLKKEIPDGWVAIEISQVLEREPQRDRVLSSCYLKKGSFPIIDQSTDFIAGYTNNKNSVIKTVKPRIIFGDHTRILKFINFDFARGADGTQVLLSNNDRMPQHLFFHTLLKLDLSNYGYARHFKFLKDMKIILPNEETANKFELIVEPFYNKIKANIFENQQLAELRDRLLPMLMNGQVKVGELDKEDILMVAESKNDYKVK